MSKPSRLTNTPHSPKDRIEVRQMVAARPDRVNAQFIARQRKRRLRLRRPRKAVR